MHRKYRIGSVIRLASLAILLALGSVAAIPESFAQEKQLTMQQRYDDGFKKIQEQDYEDGLKVLEKLKIERGDRLSETQKACIDFLRATAYYNLGKWDEADTILRNFPILYPKGIGEEDNCLAATQILLADIYALQGRWEKAREQLLKVSKMASLSQTDQMCMEIVRTNLIRKEAEDTGNPETTKKALTKALIAPLSPLEGFSGSGKGMGLGGKKWLVSGTFPGLRLRSPLKGCLFDLKRDKQGTVLATTEDGDNKRRKKLLRKALSILDTGGWQSRKLDDLYFKAPMTLYNTRIFIVNETGQALNAKLVTDVFGDEKTGKAPFKAPGWLCYYEGRFTVPEDGEYRFVGMADDAMIVGVDHKTVLYAYWPGEGFGPAVKYREGWEPQNHCGEDGTDGKNLPSPGLRSSLYKGHWLKLKANRSYYIQIAFGDASGMTAGACLGIQKKGRHDDNNFPMFSLQDSDDIPEWGISETGRYNLSENYRIPAR